MIDSSIPSPFLEWGLGLTFHTSRNDLVSGGPFMSLVQLRHSYWSGHCLITVAYTVPSCYHTPSFMWAARVFWLFTWQSKAVALNLPVRLDPASHWGQGYGEPIIQVSEQKFTCLNHQLSLESSSISSEGHRTKEEEVNGIWKIVLKLRISSLFFRVVSSTELSALENICKSIIKEKQPFERLEVRKDSLLEMFKVTGKT